MDSLDLDVQERRLVREGHARELLDELQRGRFLVGLDILPFLLEIGIIGILPQGAQIVEVADPTVGAQLVRNEIAQLRVAEGKPPAYIN